MRKLIASTVLCLDLAIHTDAFAQKSAKNGSYEAMMALGLQASQNCLAL